MTAVCGGGTSMPKTGAAAVVDYSAGLLAAIFAAYDLAWMIPIIPFIGLAPLALTTFCGTDPPSVTALTTAEAQALLTLQFGADFDSGLAKVRDMALNAVWYDACQCSTGSPTPFTPPAPPAGTPILVIPTGSGVQPCETYTGHDFVTNGGTVTYVLPPFSVEPTYVELEANVLNASGNSVMTLAYNELLTAGTFWRAWPLSINTQTIRTGTKQWALPSPKTGDHYSITINNAGSVVTMEVEWSIKVYCGANTPTVGQSPCCPPDTATFAVLDSILRVTTLLQRQLAPFAHLLGEIDSGLTGQGTIGVQGLLGVKVDLTTIPSSYGVELGSPDFHFDVGWLNVQNAEGLIEERRLVAEHTSWYPRLMSDATVIGYSLSPGVIATITQIERER